MNQELMVEAYRRMLRIRLFEEKVIDLVKKGLITGGVHSSLGQEAETVGACLALAADDYMVGNHRSHGHPIAKGTPLRPLMAELLGRRTGICKGKGGSMHLADFSRGSLGESGIVGGGLPIAAGAGLSAKTRQSGQVCLCFFGDGAANQGAVHEAFNLSGIWSLPVVFLCENNQYAVTTPTSYALAGGSVANRAAAYGFPGAEVDGQDPVAVYAAVQTAAARARDGQGPTLVEALTYRFQDHAEFGGLEMPPYRSAEEVADWRARDPVPAFRLRLEADKVLSPEQADRLEAEIRAEVDDAVQFAKDSPYPDLAETSVRELMYLQAVHEAQAEELRRDPNVILMGEDVRAGVFGTSVGFLDEFGPGRVLDTPISEAGFVGAAVGAAMTGLRPIVDLEIACFMYVAFDQLVSQAAKNRYVFGGQATVPVTFRATFYYGVGIAAQHSDRPYPMFMNMPGLKIIAPSTPYDVKGLLKSAIRDDDPVICFEDVMLGGTKGHVPEEEYLIPLGVGDVKREGSDVTVVAIAGVVPQALAAAEELAAEGVSVEVIDPRTLVPLDTGLILESVAKTGRLVIADPANRTCSAASEIAARVAEEGFHTLRAPILRVTTPDVHVPFSSALEHHLFPDQAKIADAVRRVISDKALV